MDQIRPYLATYVHESLYPLSRGIYFSIYPHQEIMKKKTEFAFFRIDFLFYSLSLWNHSKSAPLSIVTVYTRVIAIIVIREASRSIRIAGSRNASRSVVKKLAAKPEANFFSEQAWRRKKKRNEPRPFFRITRLHCAGLIPRRLVMSRRTARALVTHGKFTFQNRGCGWGALEPSKCTSKLTLHRPSIEPSPPLSLLSSPRAKNGNYCRPTIADLFFFFLHQLVAREPAIYSIFFSHSIPIFAHLRYVPPSIYIYSSNSRIYLKRYIRISILKKRTACRERRMEAINPLKDHGESVTNHLQTDEIELWSYIKQTCAEQSFATRFPIIITGRFPTTTTIIIAPLKRFYIRIYIYS